MLRRSPVQFSIVHVHVKVRQKSPARANSLDPFEGEEAGLGLAEAFGEGVEGGGGGGGAGGWSELTYSVAELPSSTLSVTVIAGGPVGRP